MFDEEFESFLSSEGIPYSRNGLTFDFSDKGMKIILVPLSTLPSSCSDSLRTVWLYEDRWRARRDMVTKRILSSLGRFRSIFARNCEVRRISAAEARPFLDAYHSYGYAKCAFFYGLYEKSADDAERELETGEIIDGSLVAVSPFSEPRRMVRYIASQGMTMDSYEWVRFASLPDCRIAGGMGKVLDAFVREINPPDIMSYSDLEWSRGDVYERLGFVNCGYREPVEFYVDAESWRRISVKKVGHDRTLRDFDTSGLVKMCNLGSIKWVKTFLKTGASVD